MDWDLLGSKCNRLRSTSFGQDECAAGEGARMDRYPALKIRQIKSVLSVSAVRRTDQLKQRFVFGNCHWRPVAEVPACRSKITGEHSDLTYIWLGHLTVSL